MFIIFGTKSVKKPVKDGLSMRRNCDRCRFLSDMGEYSFRAYFTLFFIPVFPIAKGESMMVCSRCGATFYAQTENHSDNDDDDGVEQTGDVRAIINCKYCSGRMRVPVGPGRKLLVTCPHCQKRFDA
jgi:hypothetical protein